MTTTPAYAAAQGSCLAVGAPDGMTGAEAEKRFGLGACFHGVSGITIVVAPRG